MAKIKNELKIGSLLSYLQIFFNIVLNLLYTPILISNLGKGEYGLYNTVTSIISIISLLNLGFNSGYIKFHSVYKRNNDEESINKLNGLFLIIFSIIGLVSLIIGIFVTFNLELFFENGLKPEEYEIGKWLMLLLTFDLALSFPFSVFNNIIIANEKFVFAKFISFLKVVITPIISIVFLLNGFRSISLVLILISINFIANLVIVFYVFTKLKSKFVFKNFEKQIIKKLVKYTAFIAIHLVVDQINMNLDKFWLARYVGTEEVAVYSVGFSLYAHYLTIGLAFVPLFTPIVHTISSSEKDEETKNNELSEVFIKVGRIQFLVISLFATGFIFFGQEFILFWAGEGYEDAYYVGLLLIIPGTIDLIQNISIEIQRAKELHMFRAIAYSIGAVCNTIITVLLCKKYGSIGCAIGTAISLIAIQGIAVNIYLSKKVKLNIKSFWINMLKILIGIVPPAILGIFYMIFFAGQGFITMCIGIIIYSLVYVVSIWFLSLNRYEKDGLLNYVYRNKYENK